MKKILVYASIILSASILRSQSTLVYDAGTSIDVGAGAEVCADTIIINGTYSGNGGTFCDDPLAVENADNSGTPKEFGLSQNYPNPFNPGTKIRWQMPVSSQVVLKIYNVLGNEVALLVNEEKPAGFYEINFDASMLPSGIYFYKLQAGFFVETKKMILLK